MNVRPEVPDEEIRSYMDFNKVLDEHRKTLQTQNRNALIRSVSIALVVGGAMFGFWHVLDHEQKPAETKNVLETESRHVRREPLPAQSQVDSVAAINEKIIDKKPADDSPVPVTPKTKVPSSKSSPATVEEESEKETSQVYVQAEPTDGYPVLYEYFSRELKYPKEVLADSIQGVVTVVFTINSEGKPVNISIEESLGEAFDREAMRLIENMPSWNPATFNDKPVASRISLPLTFQIKTLKPKSHE